MQAHLDCRYYLRLHLFGVKIEKLENGRKKIWEILGGRGNGEILWGRKRWASPPKKIERKWEGEGVEWKLLT